MAAIIELKQSLFEDYNDESYSYAHCISANLALSKGIATEFRAKYTDRFEELENQNPTVGNIVVWKNRDQYVYNLVTKEINSNDKKDRITPIHQFFSAQFQPE